jgi:AbrB family looped-hinge helix DNA binding protein
MDAVTGSPKFQVVIPQRVRERVGLNPGPKLRVISFDDRIELAPVRPMREMRGFLKGLDRAFHRDEEDHLRTSWIRPDGLGFSLRDPALLF